MVGGSADVLTVASQRFARGLLTFPKCEVESGRFVAYYSKHAIPHLAPEVHAGDMLLVCTCPLGLPDALEILERTLRRDVPRAVASIGARILAPALRSAAGERAGRVADSILVRRSAWR